VGDRAYYPLPWGKASLTYGGSRGLSQTTNSREIKWPGWTQNKRDQYLHIYLMSHIIEICCKFCCQEFDGFLV